jgi:hypothetical protein
VLALLDGTRTDDAVRAAALDTGMAAEDVDDVLRALQSCSALTDHDPAVDLPGQLSTTARRRLRCELATLVRRDGPFAGLTLSQRTRQRVVLFGDPRFVAPLASVLAASGVHRLWVHSTGRARLAEVVPAGLAVQDERRPRATAIADAVRAWAPEADLRPFPSGAVPDLAVVAGPVGATAGRQPLLVRRARAQLALGVRDGTAVVGPLTVPGRTACLTCVELTRTDRDPGWPALAAQLASPPDHLDLPADPCSVAGTLAAVGLAGGQILEHLDGGRPASRSASLELLSGGAVIRRRQWDPHPSCPCTHPPFAA